jgi:hypothetical protein
LEGLTLAVSVGPPSLRLNLLLALHLVGLSGMLFHNWQIQLEQFEVVHPSDRLRGRRQA